MKPIAKFLCAYVILGPGLLRLQAQVPAPLPKHTPWDIVALRKTPAYEVLTTSKDGVQEIFFRGPAYKTPGDTKVFAYYGRPKGEPGQKFPALILIHGWAGQAMRGWLTEANRRGYAAISLSTNGVMGEGGAALVPEEFRGPGDGYTGKASGASPFTPPMGEPPHHRWMYHAVADVVLAHSLLRSFSEVDPDRTAVWGISWGGYHTCIAAGLDDRFRAAVPQYGCGYLHENGAWAQNLMRMKPEQRDAWVKLWDPSQYVGSARMPMLFMNGSQDSFYPLDSWAKTRALVKSQGTRNMVSFGFGHGHFWDKRVEVAWRFLGEHLQGADKLPTISRPEIAAAQLTATVTGAKVIERPMLYYTTGPATQNGKRAWQTVPLTVQADGRLVGSAPPPDATAWFVGISDTVETKSYQNLVSSDVVFAPMR